MSWIFASFGIISLLLLCNGQSDYQSRLDNNDIIDIESMKTDEWQRYIDYQKQLMEKKLKDKPSGKAKRKNKNNVAPSFTLARTKSGFIVKQLEPGMEAKSTGGFNFPEQPVLMTNIKYKFQGSVAPEMKLAETNEGIVSKKLEFSIAEKSGASWSKLDGAVKSSVSGRSVSKINKNGQIYKNAGVSSKYPDGAISVRGTLKAIYRNETVRDRVIPIENLDPSEEETTEEEASRTGDESFEKESTEFDAYADTIEDESALDDGNDAKGEEEEVDPSSEDKSDTNGPKY